MQTLRGATTTSQALIEPQWEGMINTIKECIFLFYNIYKRRFFMKSIKTTSMALMLMLLMSPMCSLTAMDATEETISWFYHPIKRAKQELNNRSNRKKAPKASEQSVTTEQPVVTTEQPVVTTEVETTWLDKIRDWSKDKVTVVRNSVKDGYNWSKDKFAEGCSSAKDVVDKGYNWSKDKAAAGYDSVKVGFNSGITTIQENPKTSIAVGVGVAALIGVSYVIYKKLTEKTEKTDETDDK